MKKPQTASLIRAVLFTAVFCLLFAGGAGAADLGTYFLYQNVSEYNLDAGTWAYGGATVIISSDGFLFPGNNPIPGTYTLNGNSIYVSRADVTYSATGKRKSEAAYPAAYPIENGGKLYLDSEFSLWATPTVSGVSIESVILIYPDNTKKVFTTSDIKADITAPGLYRVVTKFSDDDFHSLTPDQYRYDYTQFTFTAVDITPSISASVDTLYNGESVTITVNGVPGDEYTIEVSGFDIPEKQFVDIQPTSTPNQYVFRMQSPGEVKFQITANTDQKTASIQLVGGKKLDIKIAADVVIASPSSSSYFLDDEIIITGTSTSGKPLTFSISNPMFSETDLTDYITESTSGKKWMVKFATENLISKDGEELIVGTYTIHVKQDGKTVANPVVALKQPFISFTSIPEVVTLGDTLQISGIAEGTSSIQYYIFGAGYFESNICTAKDGRFTLNIDIDSDKYRTGQYFIVIQHPMFDQNFNIYPDGTNIMLKVNSGDKPSIVFNVEETNNGIHILCDALDMYNIDDIYEKTSFLIVGRDESFTISEIPNEILEDSKLQILGVSTANKGSTVLVELIAKDCLNLPKETLGINEYLPLTTRIAEDGSWEVMINTDSLDTGDYQLIISCNSNTWKKVDMSIIWKFNRNIPLNKGWNFISVPKYLDASCDTAGELFGSLETDGISSLGYNAKTGWYVLKADTPIKPLDGYWVYTKKADEISPQYSTSVNTPPTKAVYKGWNAVGLSANGDMPANAAFSNLEWVTCLPWDMKKNNWGTPIIEDMDGEYSDERTIQRGIGNWLYVEEDGTYLGYTA